MINWRLSQIPYLLVGLVVLTVGPAWSNVILVAAPGLTTFQPGFSSVFPDSYTFQGLAFNTAADRLFLAASDSSGISSQTIYSMAITRDANGHITGFGEVCDPATCEYSAVPVGAQGVVVGGGMAFTPTGTLIYTTSNRDGVGQIGQVSGALSQLSNTVPGAGGLGYSPSGQLKLSTTSGGFYNVNLGGSGPLYTIATTLQTNFPTANSFAYAPAGFFPQAGLVAGEAASGVLNFYAVDAAGNPIGAPTPIVWLSDGDASIGYGLARDPITGDFIFTTGDRGIYVVSGIYSGVPEPGTWFSIALGLGAVAAWRRVRR